MQSAAGTLTQLLQTFTMRVCWMVLVLLVCRISHAAEAQDACTDKLQSSCVPVGHNVSVPCPELKGGKFKFFLLKDQEEIYNHTCNPQCEPPYTREGVQLIRGENNSVRFMLTRVNVGSQGVYRCRIQVKYPPPSYPEVGDAVLVLIEGHQCKVRELPEPKPCDHSRAFPLVWVLVLVPVTVYGIIVSIFAVFFWLKLRRTDSQSDYMNTKPRAPRGHRKNRGVQNPTPRYF